MDEKQLRALVREEVEQAFAVDAVVDTHPKFRRLIERRIGRKLDEDTYDTTFRAWNEMLQECEDTGLDDDLLEEYVSSTAQQLSEGHHHHMEQLSWEQVKRIAPKAFAAYDARWQHFAGRVPMLMEPMDDDEAIDVDGEPWTLMLQSMDDMSEDEPPYQWDPHEEEWVDVSRY